MEDLVRELTNGNATEVKVVLASVAVALAVYQLVVIAVGYGAIRLPFLAPAVAFRAHRAVGDVILVLVLVVSAMCIAVFGFEGEEDLGTIHVISAATFMAALAVKVILVRTHRGSRFLPFLGTGVFMLLGATWMTSAGAMLLR